MKPVRSQTFRQTRVQRVLTMLAPAISSALLGMSCVGGGAGLVASMLDENGIGLALSITLLAVAAELHLSNRPQRT